jgi:hypothetical protein
LQLLTSRLCPRCHSVLHREDAGSLVYCWNCGAPQVELSEELLEQFAQQTQLEQQAASDVSRPPVPPPPPTDAIVWSGAVRYAGLAGAIAAGFTLVSFVLPPVELLTFFWSISAPIVVLGIYAGKFSHSRITAGFAARLGLLCGLFMLLAIVGLNTIHLCLLRFVFHAAATLDTQITTVFAQEQVMLKAQFGADAAPALHMIAIPEFRAGFVLCCFGIFASMYLAFTTTAGAFAGFLRSRAR